MSTSTFSFGSLLEETDLSSQFFKNFDRTFAQKSKLVLAGSSVNVALKILKGNYFFTNLPVEVLIVVVVVVVVVAFVSLNIIFLQTGLNIVK